MIVLPAIDSSQGTLALWALIGYGLGSVPFGLLLVKLMKLGNLRQIGSGNIGATNVLRTGNKIAAALTLLLDGGKGALAVLFAHSFAGDATAQIAGLFAMFGHCYPAWLFFKGGKGVATLLGVLLALNFTVGIASCATWISITILKRISSLSALVAVVSSILWSIVFEQQSLIALCIILNVLVFWRHQENISRLLSGKEPKLRKSKEIDT
tara:strand:+ start:223 stop:852 length:630 start_codon:yes stop_codon:yes gene_type:complete